MSNIDKHASNLWGLAKDGTNLWWDIFFTFLATYFTVLIVDGFLPDDLQETATALTNTVIIGAGVSVWLLAWNRMRKDNRNRKVVDTMTPQQKQAALVAAQ